jgi:hypothetical protein
MCGPGCAQRRARAVAAIERPRDGPAAPVGRARERLVDVTILLCAGKNLDTSSAASPICWLVTAGVKLWIRYDLQWPPEWRLVCSAPPQCVCVGGGGGAGLGQGNAAVRLPCPLAACLPSTLPRVVVVKLRASKGGGVMGARAPPRSCCRPRAHASLGRPDARIASRQPSGAICGTQLATTGANAVGHHECTDTEQGHGKPQSQARHNPCGVRKPTGAWSKKLRSNKKNTVPRKNACPPRHRRRRRRRRPRAPAAAAARSALRAW